MRFGVISLALGSALVMAVAGATVAGTNPDNDTDGQFNLVDNCTEDQNNGQAGTGPAQADSDRDGFGTLCDADYDNTGTVNVTDFNFFVGCFLEPSIVGGGSPSGIFSGGIECTNMDMNTSDTINVGDFNFFIGKFLAGLLGPSGLPCAFLDSSADNMTGKYPCEYDQTPND